MAKTKADIKKVLLAYSGGLDTSVIIPWLNSVLKRAERIRYVFTWRRSAILLSEIRFTAREIRQKMN